jgi:HEAT repeat protein
MLKRLVMLLLEFGAGIAGNLAAGWIQQDKWSNLFTPSRILATLGGAALMLLILAWLESERALPWNWPWHRYWYLREVLGDRDLRRWEADFARLEVAQRLRKVSAAEVIAEGQRQDLVEVLHELIAGRWGEARRGLVLGEPGSGKTTGLERLTLDLAREGAQRLGFGQPMPVLVRLGDFQKGELLDYVGQAMRHGTRGGSGKVLGKGIEKLVEQGQVVLLFDALDEALGKRRDEVLAALGIFLESKAYRNVSVVITSRTREDPGGRLVGVPVLEIQELSDEAVEVFIRAYKQPEHSEEKIRERLEWHGLLEPKGLGRNPFWLRLIVKSGAFVGNKGRILIQAVDDLLAREWDKKPEAQRSWRRVLPRDDQSQETKRALAWLGYRMSVENQVALDGDRALVELAEWLKGRVGVEGLRPQDVLGLGRDAQVLVYEPGPVRFRHRLLQEFMTAWALTAEEGLFTQELERCVQNSGWWETLLMLGGLVQDHATLVRGVLGDGSDDRRLFLAVGLLQSVGKPDREMESQVMAALVNSLRRGVTPAHKQAAVELAKIIGDEVVEALGGLLWEEDRAVKEGAVEILGEVKGGKAAEVLIGSLRDETIAGSVWRVLLSIGEPAVGPLIRALRRWDVRQGAAEALGKIGEPAVEPLIGALQDEESKVREGAAEALGKIKDARAVEPLIGALQDKDNGVRRAVAEALRGIREPAVEPLIRALQDGGSDMRRAVAEALGKIGDARAVEPLIRALQGGDSDVRRAVVEVLGTIKDARAVEPLIGALGDETFWVRRRAADALGWIMDARAVGPLIEALRDENATVRKGVALALGMIGDARAVEPLIEALRDEISIVRLVAAQALGKIGDVRAVEPLIGVLGDEDGYVRLGAASALEWIGDTLAVESLVRALGDVDGNVRWGAAGALGAIGDPKALPHLERAVIEDKGANSLGYTVAAAAREAMERIRAAQRMEDGKTNPPE